MEMQTSPTHTPSAQVVGNSFVEQYYNILHQHPELVFRFYKDSSVLSRPEPDGSMLSVETIQAINEVIISQDYKDYKAEIRTIDAQDSYKEGVLVLVTGWLTVKDNVKRAFTQSFFLASQDKGYFVLNDVFRYVDEYNSPEPNAVSVNDITENIPSAPVISDPEASRIPDHPVADNTTPAVEAVEVAYGNGEMVHEPSNNGEVSVMKVLVVEAPDHSGQNEVPPVAELVSTVQEGTPKMSYASIVKAKPTSPVCVPTTARKLAAATAGQHSAPSPAPGQHSAPTPAPGQHSAPTPAPEASARSSNIGSNSSKKSEEVEGNSIYIWGLCFNTKVLEVEEELKKFGAIRPNGVQVRNNNQGFCFGFVEFISSDSMQSALEASTVTIGDRQAHIEKKRTTTRVGPNGRPKVTARNGFRDDNYRGRGNFGGGGWGYDRNESGNQGGFSGRQGQSGRSRDADGYHQVDHKVGNGRIGRQGGMKLTAVSA